ncbi:MAG TPA: hypothetical protein VF462_06550 [Micromonosporaceae bacterium]
MLLDERTSAREFGRFRFSTRREPALPGTPSVTVVDRPALGSVAVAEGDDLWVEEYLSASNCSIRRVRPGGRTVQAPRKVPCGTQPLAQTAAEQTTYAWVEPFDRHWAIVFTDLATGAMALHDARTGSITPMAVAVRRDERRLLLLTWRPGAPRPTSYAYDRPIAGMLAWPAP